MTEVREIAKALRFEADALASFLLPGGKYEFGNREWKCSAEFSPTGGAISVHVGRGRKQGVCGFWNDVKPGGDMLDLIERVFNLSKAEAIQWGKDWLGISDLPAREVLRTKPPSRPRNLQTGKDDDEKRIFAAQRIWDNADPVSGPTVEYLARRGIGYYCDDELRSVRNLSHPDGGIFPALVARVSDPGGNFSGIWRIYVKVDGSGKAPVDTPKLGLGVVKGGAVRLGGPWPVIGLAEGIETALACYEIIGRAIPVWAALSTSGIRGFVPPGELTAVRIYPDADPAKFGRDGRIIPSPGLEAARDLQKKLCEKGISVRIEPPPVGQDWLDVLNSTKVVK